MSSDCLRSGFPTLFTAHFLKNIDHELYTVYLFILVGSMSVLYILSVYIMYRECSAARCI